MKNINRQILLTILLIMLAIIVFHTSINLNEIVSPPTDKWGRDISLKEATPYRKQPSIMLDDKNTHILLANDKNFVGINIDRKKARVTKENLAIKGASLNKIIDFEWAGQYILWTENYDLFYSMKDGSGKYSEKTLLMNNVNDFQTISGKDSTYVAVAGKAGMRIYKADASGISQLGTDYALADAKAVSVAEDTNGVLHVAGFSVINEMEYPIKYLTFAQSQWTLRAEVSEKMLYRSWKIPYIEIGLDKNNAYMFYSTTKWDQFGQSARSFYSYVPLNQSTVQPLKFNRLLVFPNDNPENSYENDIRCSKLQSDQIDIIVAKDSYGKRGEQGFTLINLKMADGKITDRIQIIKNKGWVGNTEFKQYNGDNVLSYIVIADKFQFDTYYTETGKAYMHAANSGKPMDYVYALLNTLAFYVSALAMVLIKTFILAPTLLWLFYAEYKNIKLYKKNRNAVYFIGIGIYLIMKFVTMGTYYTEVSMSLMPAILASGFAKYFTALLLTGVCFFLSKLFRKKNEEMNYMVEFIILGLFDLLFTTFIYSPYLM